MTDTQSMIPSVDCIVLPDALLPLDNEDMIIDDAEEEEEFYDFETVATTRHVDVNTFSFDEGIWSLKVTIRDDEGSEDDAWVYNRERIIENMNVAGLARRSREFFMQYDQALIKAQPAKGFRVDDSWLKIYKLEWTLFIDNTTIETYTKYYNILPIDKRCQRTYLGRFTKDFPLKWPLHFNFASIL